MRKRKNILRRLDDPEIIDHFFTGNDLIAEFELIPFFSEMWEFHRQAIMNHWFTWQPFLFEDFAWECSPGKRPFGFYRYDLKMDGFPENETDFLRSKGLLTVEEERLIKDNEVRN